MSTTEVVKQPACAGGAARVAPALGAGRPHTVPPLTDAEILTAAVRMQLSDGAGAGVRLLHPDGTAADARGAGHAVPGGAEGGPPLAGIGIVLGGAADGSALNALRNADMAMYQAKRAGRGTFAFFDPAMLAQLSRAVLIESGLRHAIRIAAVGRRSAGRARDLGSGAMVSVEALVRWRYPELGACRRPAYATSPST